MSAAMISRTAFGVRAAPARAVRSRTGVRVMAAAKPNWLPGSTIPSYLEGLPASYGFDPLKLGEDSAALRWYQQAELVHCRWAMLGAAGVLGTSVLGLTPWYEAGAASQASSTIPFATNIVILHVLVGFVEMKRLQDFLKPGSQAEPGSFLGLEGAFAGKEVGYPGGLFDPMGMSKGDGYQAAKVKEIKNGRLAMMACLGFFAQWKATGTGPLENLGAHMADPWSVNFATNGVSLPGL